MIQESLEEMNGMLQKSQKRLQHWVVESHETKQLITSLGTVTFEKTLFKNKETGECEYLLDRILGLEKHERISEDALARMLKEAVQSSYRRGGEETSLTTDVNKQTVKNKTVRPSTCSIRFCVVPVLFIPQYRLFGSASAIGADQTMSRGK